MNITLEYIETHPDYAGFELPLTNASGINYINFRLLFSIHTEYYANVSTIYPDCDTVQALIHESIGDKLGRLGPDVIDPDSLNIPSNCIWYGDDMIQRDSFILMDDRGR